MKEKTIEQQIIENVCFHCGATPREQESIASGQPTPQQWYEAVDKANEIIAKATE